MDYFRLASSLHRQDSIYQPNRSIGRCRSDDPLRPKQTLYHAATFRSVIPAWSTPVSNSLVCLWVFCFICVCFIFFNKTISDAHTHSIHRKEGNVLFNDALNTFFYLRLYGVGHMVKDHSDSERRNPLSPHGLLFSISIKGSFICTITQTG